MGREESCRESAGAGAVRGGWAAVVQGPAGRTPFITQLLLPNKLWQGVHPTPTRTVGKQAKRRRSPRPQCSSTNQRASPSTRPTHR
jgi:hypothetical protein